MKNIVIACGGTGGHLTPGIALAQALEEKGHKVWLFISQKSVDSRLAKKYGTLNFKPMPGAPLKDLSRTSSIHQGFSSLVSFGSSLLQESFC